MPTKLTPAIITAAILGFEEQKRLKKLALKKRSGLYCKIECEIDRVRRCDSSSFEYPIKYRGPNPRAQSTRSAALDHRSLNTDTFNSIYVLMDYALPEEAQSRPVHGAGDAQA
jgi:hypothetical protein